MKLLRAGKLHPSLETRKALIGYLFILPFMAGFIAFLMIPLIQSFLMVFSRVEINAVKQQYSMTFTGLDNLRRVFLIDPDFTRLLSEEILRMVLIVPAILIFSLFIAVLLNQHFPGRGLVRAIFFLPVIFSSGIIVQLELNSTLLNSMAGIYQEANTAKYSVSFFIQDIFSGIGNNNAFASFSDYIFDIVDQIQLIVMSSGIQIIIFLSALQSIPPSMFEAAEMEGSTKWESFWKISFPMVSPLIVVNIVYSVVDYFLRTDNELMMRIRRILMQNMEYGYYSAMAWVYFLAVILILGIVNLLISRRVYYYD